jgi:hypothetical protein
MKERPILFSAPMVRALLDGSKTQTRRAVKGEMLSNLGDLPHVPDWITADVPRLCPYGQPGDRLWVRETWRHTAGSLDEARALTEDIASGTAVDWRATYIERCIKELGFSREEAEQADSFETWRPSIHMPRWASRILLEVVSVRVERLQSCSDSDARAEGIVASEFDPSSPVFRYACLWDDINGRGSWNANPWVWVVEFRRVQP